MKFARPLLLAVVLASSAAFGQVITKFAGNGITSVPLGGPQGIAVNASGSVYVADTPAHRIYKISGASNIVLREAGLPQAVAVGGGVAYVAGGAASTQNVDRLDANTGAILSAFAAGSQNPVDVMIDGSTLWISLGSGPGTFGSVVRVDATTGALTGIVGSPGSWSPRGIAKDSAGNVYVADAFFSKIYKFANGTGSPFVVAGTSAGFSGDGGPAGSAQLNQPVGMAVDAAGNVFFADKGNNRVRRIDAVSGNITTVAGGGVGGDGAATSAQLSGPHGLALLGTALYVSEEGGKRIRKIEGGVISTIAGATVSSGDGGPALSATLKSPFATAFDAAGNAFIAESDRVRRVEAGTGIITTFAGGGANPPNDGAPATSVSVAPGGIAIDPSGNVYLSDAATATIRKVPAGASFVVRVAGNGQVGESGDGGPASSASLSSATAGPAGLAIGPSALYVAAGTRVRKIDLNTGIITTVAGGGANNPPPDNTPALSADIGVPVALTVDPVGNLLVIALRGQTSTLYRVVLSSGLISTVATPSGLGRMSGVAVDGGGDIFVSVGANFVMRIAPSGVVINVVGTGQAGAVAEGEFGNATPFGTAVPNIGVAIGPAGHLYVSAADMGRVFRLTLSGIMATPPAIVMAGRLPGTTSLAQSVLLTQLGSTAAPITGMTPPAGFAVTHNCGASLAAYAVCAASVTFNPPSVGTFTGAIDVNSPSAQDILVSGNGENTLVTHFYEMILRRTPDVEGKAFWDSERVRMQGLGANVNETWFAMSSFFYASGEYQGFNRNASDFVTDLYRTFFNRDPDAAGLQFWINQMANGMPREVVLAQFQHSPEFLAFTTAIFGNPPVRAEINMVMDFYRGLLGRLPDNGGFNAWVGNFRTAQCQGAAQVGAMASSISSQFALSAEYIGKNRTNPQFVGDLYNAFLRRGGDLDGVNFWIGQLNTQSMSRDTVRGFFEGSSEFQGRVSSVASQGCLP